MRRVPAAILVILALAAGIGVGVFAGRTVMGPSPSASGIAAVTASPTTGQSATAAVTPTDSPAPTDSPTPQPTPTPSPTPVLVADPLDGVPVDPSLASRHVVAVMIDDQAAARPQSGLSMASQVWQAPAEGGIPRYVALFSESDPPSVGPIRSSRLYFIAWAAEWNSVYAHVGGSPQALALLKSAQGQGKVVWNADEFRFGAAYMWRVKTRFAPHNVYTDGRHLRLLVKATHAPATMKYTAHWQFAPDLSIDQRPVGGSIVVPYLANRVSYAYDQASNTYLRSVTGEARQTDAGTQQRIAPKNVVVIFMSFAPLNDGSGKHRLEAQFTGTGKALVFTNGGVVKGTWKKASMTAPTLLFGPDGKPVTLTIGQTFVQVVQIGTTITYKLGTVPPPAPSASPSPSGSPSPSDQPSPSASPVGDVVDRRFVL